MKLGVQAMLSGMPEHQDLHRHETDGQTTIYVGARVVSTYATADLGLRNMAIVALTDLGFTGVAVAEVMGLTSVYVSMLRGRRDREGSAGLVGTRGRPPKISASDARRAAEWRAEGVSDVAIGTRLGVTDKTVAKALRDTPPPQPEATPQERELFDPDPDPDPDLDPEGEASPDLDLEGEASPDLDAGDEGEADTEADPADAPGPGVAPAPEGEPAAVPDADWGSARIREGVFGSRYAGAALVHAFTDRVGATGVFSQAGRPGGGAVRFDDVALLAATSMAFTLGAGTVEAVKHLTRAHAGPLCGLTGLPDLRTLRPRLAALADRCDPLELQRAFAAAMLAAQPSTSDVYYVDDHFVPYTGAKPVPKGWDTKHRVAQKGRADTWVTDATGRAVVFATGEPSGLTKTLPGVLAQLRAVLAPEAKIMLGFDRGGAYPEVFNACRAAGADWITYRRAPLVTPTCLPQVHTTTTGAGTKQEQTTHLVYAEETVTINGYDHDEGLARQITLFENGAVALQILTSDMDSCPMALLTWLKGRWRIENAFKYGGHYGIDTLADYIADIETNTRPVANPARKHATAAVTTAKTALADAEHTLAELMADRSINVTALNRALPGAQADVEKARKALTAAKKTRDTHPAKLPANQINPNAARALLATTRRCLQMVLRLLAYNAEQWLAEHLNAYLRDNDEYRAITRQTILRGLAGTLTYTPDTITIALDRPDTPKTAQALTLLLEEINNTPPRIPGDHRPITYTLNPTTVPGGRLKSGGGDGAAVLCPG